MRIRTARAILQRLALVAGLCAGAWLASEALDHGTARADDVPVRTETEQPGGLLDQVDAILDEVLPEPPARPTPNSDPEPQPEPDDEQTEEPDRPRPIEDTLDDVGEVDTPDPADGDDGRPQHPVDTPPDPGPTTPPPAVIPDLPELPDIETPADLDPRPALDVIPPAGDLETTPPFGGEHHPAPYVPIDVQTWSWGEPVCDSRDDRGTPVTDDRSGTRDRLASPRGLAGPGPQQPLDDPCDPNDVPGAFDPPPFTPGTYAGLDLPPCPTACADAWLPDPHRDVLGHDRHDDILPMSRHTAWPPGPG